MLLKAVLIVCVVRKERKENIGLAHASFISLRRAGGRRSGQDGGARTSLPIGWKSRSGTPPGLTFFGPRAHDASLVGCRLTTTTDALDAFC